MPEKMKHARAALVMLGGILMLALLGCASGQKENAAEVRACMADHHLQRAAQQVSVSDNEFAFASCEWPVHTWADQDGYSEIRVRSFDGPGEGEASGANRADYISAPCQRVELTYDFGSQGAHQFLDPFIAAIGTVTWSNTPGKPWQGTGLNPYPKRDEVVYLRNDKQVLYQARCVE